MVSSPRPPRTTSSPPSPTISSFPRSPYKASGPAPPPQGIVAVPAAKLILPITPMDSDRPPKCQNIDRWPVTRRSPWRFPPYLRIPLTLQQVLASLLQQQPPHAATERTGGREILQCPTQCCTTRNVPTGSRSVGSVSLPLPTWRLNQVSKSIERRFRGHCSPGQNIRQRGVEQLRVNALAKLLGEKHRQYGAAIVHARRRYGSFFLQRLPAAEDPVPFVSIHPVEQTIHGDVYDSIEWCGSTRRIRRDPSHIHASNGVDDTLNWMVCIISCTTWCAWYSSGSSYRNPPSGGSSQAPGVR